MHFPAWEVPQVVQRGDSDIGIPVFFLTKLSSSAQSDFLQLLSANSYNASSSESLQSPKLYAIPWIRKRVADRRDVYDIAANGKPSYDSTSRLKFLNDDTYWYRNMIFIDGEGVQNNTAIITRWTPGQPDGKLEAARVPCATACKILDGCTTRKEALSHHLPDYESKRVQLGEEEEQVDLPKITQSKQTAENKDSTSTDSSQPKIIALDGFGPRILRRVTKVIKEGSTDRTVNLIEWHNSKPATRVDLYRAFQQEQAGLSVPPSQQFAFFLDNTQQDDDGLPRLLLARFRDYFSRGPEPNETMISVTPLSLNKFFRAWDIIHSYTDRGLVALMEKRFVDVSSQELVADPVQPIEFALNTESFCLVMFSCAFTLEEQQRIRREFRELGDLEGPGDPREFMFIPWRTSLPDADSDMQTLISRFGSREDPAAASASDGHVLRGYPLQWVAVDRQFFEDGTVILADASTYGHPSEELWIVSDRVGWQYGRLKVREVWIQWVNLELQNQSIDEGGMVDGDVEEVYLEDVRDWMESEARDRP